MISENLQEENKNVCKSEEFEKIGFDQTSNKDRESLDKQFVNQTTDNRKNKILMIGEKRVTSEFSSSRSHERI